MKTENVEFFVGSARVRALWRTPDQSDGAIPAVVQGPGWLGLKSAKDYVPTHEALTAAGFGVLVIDYRGFGDSEGERGIVVPAHQLEDLIAGVSYLTTREDVDAEAIGAYATGGTGGGNVILLAAADERVRAVVSQVPVADGRDWLHRMRTEYDWIRFLEALEEDRRSRVRTGVSRLVDPREDVMVQTPERRSTPFKKDVDAKVTEKVPLSMVDGLLHYRPLDAARGLRTPLLVIAVDRDATTPTDHAVSLYEAAAGPRKLLIQRHTSHYAAYARYAGEILPEICAWFGAHLRGPGAIVARSAGGART